MNYPKTTNVASFRSFSLNITKSLLLLLGALGSSGALAQVTKNVTATTDQRCYRLVGDEYVPSSPPGKGGLVQQISEPIKCTATVASEPTWVIDSYAWNGNDLNGNPVIDFKGNNTGSTATGYFHAPGTAKLGCLVTYHLSTDPNKTPKYAQGYSKVVYCIGGPIQYGEVSGATGTPTRYPSLPNSFAPGPAYTQYFTIDPAKPITNGWQTPQSATASPYPNQPGTTTYTWTVPSGFERLDQAGPNATIISFGATGTNQGVEAKLQYTFNNNDPSDPVTRTVYDDSLQSMYIDPFSDTGVVDKDLGKVGAYQPKSVQPITSKNFSRGNPYVQGTAFSYCLLDQNGTPMPGVYITERWDNANIAAADSAGFVWPPQDSADFEDDLYFDAGAPYTHPMARGVPIASAVHRYFAATTDGSLYDPTKTQSGILVMTTTTSWFDDGATNP